MNYKKMIVPSGIVLVSCTIIIIFLLYANNQPLPSPLNYLQAPIEKINKFIDSEQIDLNQMSFAKTLNETEYNILFSKQDLGTGENRSSRLVVSILIGDNIFESKTIVSKENFILISDEHEVREFVLNPKTECLTLRKDINLVVKKVICQT